MANKRSLRFVNRPESLAYLEILLEALVVIVVATELSLVCSTYLFPEWHKNAAVPRAKTGFINSVLGYGQKRDFQTGSFLLSSIDRTSNRKLLSIGSMVLISAAGALYLTFTLFIWANRDWKPPVLYSPTRCPKLVRTQETIIMLFWLVPCPQAVAVFLLVIGHVGWSAVPVPLWPDIWSFYGFLALVMGLLMWLPSMLFITADMKLFSQAERVVHQWKSWKCGFMAVLETCMPFAIAGVLALAPALPALIWAGMVQCCVAIFGTAAGFPGCIVLSCILIMYITGRMLGFWMTGSNVAWIANKILLLTGHEGYLEQIFPCGPSKGNILGSVSCDSLKRRFGLVLDWMNICILSNAAWSSYVGGTTQSYRSLDVLNWIVDVELPKCMSTMMVQFFSGKDNNAPCNYLNNTLSELETTMGNAGYITAGLIAYSSTISLYFTVHAVYVYVIIAWLVMAIKNCMAQKKSVPRTVYEQTNIQNLHKWSTAMSIAPLFLTKVVLSVYALDFVLPERFYLLGVTVCLVCYTAFFSWGCMNEVFDWVKAHLTCRTSGYHRDEEGKLIETDNNGSTKSGYRPKDTADGDDDCSSSA